jgi:hypothetical protein
MIEIYKCVLRPQLLPQFFAGYDVAPALKKRQENLEGLLLQLYSAASFPQLARPLVHFEGSKADNPGLISIRHCQPRIASVALKTRFPGVRAGYVSLLRDPLWETGAPLVLGIDVDGVTSNSEVANRIYFPDCRQYVREMGLCNNKSI